MTHPPPCRQDRAAKGAFLQDGEAPEVKRVRSEQVDAGDAEIKSIVYVRLPVEDQQAGEVHLFGKLIKAMYDTRGAAQNWQKGCSKTIRELGFDIGDAPPCHFYLKDTETCGMAGRGDYHKREASGDEVSRGQPMVGDAAAQYRASGSLQPLGFRRAGHPVNG